MAIAILISLGGVAPKAIAAEMMPTEEECASGAHNGVHLGRHVGSATICLSAEGTVILYAGGRVSPPVPCGSVRIGDKTFVEGDPNACDSFGPSGGDHLTYRVQLPSDYDGSGGRLYPTLYLLPGGEGDEDRWFELDPTLPQLADQGVVIVSVFNQSGFYNDWFNGEHEFESLYTTTLIEAIDSAFRTIPDRAYRAVAGVSEGGYGAMLFAARHPELFVAAASFSGPLDITDPAFLGPSAIAHSVGFTTYEDPVGTWMPIFGDPVREEVRWHGRNPTDLAVNLNGVSVWHSAGDGVPSGSDVVGYGPGVAPQAALETLVRRMNDQFDGSLSRAAIPHDYRARSGIHVSEYAVQDLHNWFPTLLKTFGSAPPESFDHVSIDPTFAAWDWTVRVDEQRALEFMALTDASISGATLRGSGQTTVTTAAYFGRSQRVLLDGAVESSVVADEEGRITFTVDLGPAHAHQQYTTAQLAAAALVAEYFVSRGVTFTPCPGRAANAGACPPGGSHQRRGGASPATRLPPVYACPLVYSPHPA